MKIALERACECLDGPRFGEAGRALHQQMTVRKQSDEQTLDQDLLADDLRGQVIAGAQKCSPGRARLRRGDDTECSGFLHINTLTDVGFMGSKTGLRGEELAQGCLSWLKRTLRRCAPRGSMGLADPRGRAPTP